MRIPSCWRRAVYRLLARDTHTKSYILWCCIVLVLEDGDVDDGDIDDDDDMDMVMMMMNLKETIVQLWI